jgi:hypothetical protein
VSRVLPQDEIRDITHKVRYSAQIRALRSLGFEVKIRPDGSPLVSESNFEKVTGGYAKTERVDVKLNLDFDESKKQKPRK